MGVGQVAIFSYFSLQYTHLVANLLDRRTGAVDIGRRRLLLRRGAWKQELCQRADRKRKVQKRFASKGMPVKASNQSIKQARPWKISVCHMEAKRIRAKKGKLKKRYKAVIRVRAYI